MPRWMRSEAKMDMLSMNDGTIEYVSDLRDFAELIDKYMGLDARRWLDDLLEEALEDTRYSEELEKEIEHQEEYHKGILKSIRTHSEKLAELIGAKELDRREISNTAGAIGVITWREINR